MTARTNSVAVRLLVLFVALGAVFLLLTLVGAADGLPTPSRAYIVESGDTLWEIAADVTPRGGDVRDAVAVIAVVNGLADATIQPGQALLIPAF